MKAKSNSPSILSDTSTLVDGAVDGRDNGKSAWSKAMAEYLHDDSLTKEERNICRLDSSDDFISDLEATTLTNIQKSRLHQGMKRIQPFLKILEKFKGALDVFSQADPHGVLACVWGSIRLVLVVSITLREISKLIRAGDERYNGFL